MNLCVIADIHGTPKYVPRLKELEYDLLIVCGDITHFGHSQEAMKILDRLPEPYLAVHGNCDYTDVLEALDRKGCNLHEKSVEKGEVFFGFGGGNHFLGKTPCEYTEEEIYEGLSRAPESCILVTHVPPKDTKADRSLLKHVGSKAVRRVAEEKNSRVILCGHIHESRNSDYIRGTLVINPGEFSKGYYALVSTEDSTFSLEQFR